MPGDASPPSLEAERRLRRVAAVWNWLPAFRAVAETEHLPTAAERLGTSPPALSRMVRLLEDAAGVALFERVGGRLRLNDAGRELLAGARDAMRTVDDALDRAAGEALAGRVRVVADGVAAQGYVLPALTDLCASHPTLVARLCPPPADLVDALLQGHVDVVFRGAPFRHPSLAVDDLGARPNGVYCGPGHPLHAAPAPTEADVLAATFASVLPGPDGYAPDGWPPSVPRRVGMELPDLGQVLAACRDGGALAVLPVAVAARVPELRRLPFAGVRDSLVVAVRRPPLGYVHPAELVLDAVRARMRAEPG